MSLDQINAAMFTGMRILESAYLTTDGTPYTVRRTWRERLFNRPWRPWITTRTVVPQVPYQGVVQLDDHTLIMHPETRRQLQALFDHHKVRLVVLHNTP